MKQCPACKTTYTDESLKFCLSDGNLLSGGGETEQPTLVFQDRNPMQVNIPQNTAPNTFQLPTTPVQTNKKSSLPLILIALFALVLLAIIGVGAVFLFKPFGANETAIISNNSANSNNSNTKTNASTDTQSKELEDKLANLERQLQEQKNQKKTTTPQPFSTQPPTVTAENSGNPTARVKPSGDGFLSLRTEPNVKTGTQLIKIPTGATVKLENCEKNFLTIDGRRGRWCMVSYNGETGWAFDAWLDY